MSKENIIDVWHDSNYSRNQLNGRSQGEDQEKNKQWTNLTTEERKKLSEWDDYRNVNAQTLCRLSSHFV